MTRIKTRSPRELQQMHRSHFAGSSGGGCLGLLFVFLVFSLPMAFWTDRNLDFWLTQFKGETVDVHFGLSWIASLLGPMSFGANLFGEIIRLVI